MQVITSKENEIIKNIKKLKEKKYRDKSNKFIIEGIKLVEEAIEENANIELIVICDECIETDTIPKDFLYKIAKYECIYVTKKIFEMLTDVKSPQGVLAIINKKTSNKNIDYSQDIIIVLDGIQDPGNLGTILRTVDSANLKQIVLSKNSADSFNPKVVRSTMGAIFRINIIESENLMDTLKEIKENGFDILATSLDDSKDIYDIDYKNKAIVIGNEANGVSENIQKMADDKIRIPMLGKTESLNASVATGIIIYEYVRGIIKK